MTHKPPPRTHKQSRLPVAHPQARTAIAPEPSLPLHPLLRLQGQVGNASVARLLARESTQLAREAESDETNTIEVEPVAPITGQGKTHEEVAYAGASRVPRLQGVTRASFNGGSFRTENVVTEAGGTCRRCGKRDCVHVTGSVVIDYVVTTTVTLPPVPRNLRPCEQEKVREAIDTILAPHEQQHVDAFSQYNGTVTLPLDETLCRAALPKVVEKMVKEDERPRRAAAKDASAALDPFNFDFDMTCQEE